MAQRTRPYGAVLPVILALAAAALAAGIIAFYAELRLSRLVLGGLGESFSTKVYAAPFIIDGRIASSPDRLIQRLERLGYSQTPAPFAPGQFSWQEPTLTVSLRGFKSPRQTQEPGVFLLTRKNEQWAIFNSSGGLVSSLAFEPELAAELSGPKKIRREPAEAADIPAQLKTAVLVTEDKRFYSHWGIDYRAVARALKANLTGRHALQGGSTITQQLSKNIFLSPKRNLTRKAAEAALAFYLELRYGKERILTLYLNHIYLGQDGLVSVAGVKSAAQFYFGKNLKALSLTDCALLAGLISSPYRYNPLRNPRAAKERRDFVLRRLRDEGKIGAEELRAALAQPLALRSYEPPKGEKHDSDYFLAEVIRQLLQRYGDEALFRYGLSIYTTMDPLLQRGAQHVIRLAQPQGALVALDPATGKVLALSGGRDFGASQFNRATQAQRQPGSAFKPFVYGAALEAGFTPATILIDKPRSFSKPLLKTWNPSNYNGVYFGTATMRQALAHSLNAATLDLAEKTGTGSIIAFAQKLGLRSPLENSLATALGSCEVNLLELSAAYAPFANGGFRVSPQLIEAVTDANGTILEFSRSDREPVFAPALSYLMTSLLQSVVSEGTARVLLRLAWNRPLAGKTGTTNDGRDAWFIGYTPGLLAGVWVGDDQHRSLNATGAKNAVPLWGAFMMAAKSDLLAGEFPQPQGLVSVTIDPVSGLRARAGCPTRRAELFLAGTEPSADCPLHPGGVLGWFKRVFGKT